MCSTSGEAELSVSGETKDKPRQFSTKQHKNTKIQKYIRITSRITLALRRPGNKIKHLALLRRQISAIMHPKSAQTNGLQRASPKRGSSMLIYKGKNGELSQSTLAAKAVKLVDNEMAWPYIKVAIDISR